MEKMERNPNHAGEAENIAPDVTNKFISQRENRVLEM